MKHRHKELLIRWALLAVLGAACSVLFSPLYYRPKLRVTSGVTLAEVGVTIQSGDKPGTTFVKVDDREETIPRGQEKDSALWQEAMQRIAANSNSSERYLALNWSRFIRWCLPPMAIAYWLLFRVWQPRRDYVEGPSV